MAQSVNSYLAIGSLQGFGSESFECDDLTARDRPGRYFYGVTAFGPVIYQYIRNTTGSALTQGQMVSRLADVSVANITSGSTTGFVKAASLTADKHVGEMLYVVDNDDSAGAAPEGEVSIISSNTAGLANVDPNFPYSVALAANDDLNVVSPGWHTKAAAAADKAQECRGAVVAKGGITSLYYGFTQVYGIHPHTVVKTGTAIATRAACILDTLAISVDANGGWELVVGYNMSAIQADLVGLFGVIFHTAYSPTLNAGTP